MYELPLVSRRFKANEAKNFYITYNQIKVVQVWLSCLPIFLPHYNWLAVCNKVHHLARPNLPNFPGSAKLCKLLNQVNKWSTSHIVNCGYGSCSLSQCRNRKRSGNPVITVGWKTRVCTRYKVTNTCPHLQSEHQQDQLEDCKVTVGLSKLHNHSRSSEFIFTPPLGLIVLIFKYI